MSSSDTALEREGAETLTSGFLPYPCCLPCLPRPKHPNQPPDPKASLSSVLACLSTVVHHYVPRPCLLHRPDISRGCVAQLPDQYLSLPPLNRWPCLSSPCIIPKRSHYPEFRPQILPSLSLEGHFPRCWSWLHILACTVPAGRNGLSSSHPFTLQ